MGKRSYSPLKCRQKHMHINKIRDICMHVLGVAFFLYYFFHTSKIDFKKGKNTRILPDHYYRSFTFIERENGTCKTKLMIC